VATVLLLVAVVVLALAAAVTGRALRAERARGRRRAQSLRAEAEQERQGVEEHLRRAQAMVRRQSEALTQVRRAWQAEREWSRELRAQIAHIRTRPDGFPGDAGLPDLVLEAALKLLEADRGLLLSSEDRDADGRLDVVAAKGFVHDPRNSAIAQRFAREVLERDAIVREDHPTADGGPRTPADDEIRCFVAIPVYLRDRFHGVVICANRRGGFEQVDDNVLLALGDHAGTALQHGRLRHQLQAANRAAVRILVEAVAARDPELHRESSRLAVLAVQLAHELGLASGEREVLVGSVLLRGVGDLALPQDLRLQPGPLSAEQRAMVELHPRIGFTVIGQAEVLRDVATTVLYHQERWDGGGYPAGLAGGDIPRLARALAVLETYGALTHPRGHRDACSPEAACEVLVDEAGRQLDPEITQVFVELVRRSSALPSAALAEGVVAALPFDPVAATDELLSPLGGPATDGLTLLGDHRALQHGVSEAVRGAQATGRGFALAMVQIQRLPEINQESSFLVGDRVIHVAARTLRRVGARLQGTCYRASGRRLALLVPLREELTPEGIAAEIDAEFVGGPEIRYEVLTWHPGERSEDLIVRGRHALVAA